MKKCKYCDKQFIPVGNCQKFCSKNCCNIYHRPRYNAANNKRNKENYKSWNKVYNPSKRICLTCHKIFISEGNWNRVCKPCKSRNPEFSKGNIFDYV